MEIRVLAVDQVAVLDVEGEIDHFVAPQLQQQIEALLDQGAENLILDFSRVSYLDSGGIGVLFWAMKQLLSRHGRLGIVSHDLDVIRILELVGLFDERTNVTLYGERPEAVKMIATSTATG